jgi:hypothetical protein
VDDLLTKELTQSLQSAWAPCFTLGPERLFSRDVYHLETTALTYPSKGRKLKIVPGSSSFFFFFVVSGLETYYSKYVPLLSQQPAFKQQLPASVFEANLAAVTEQRGSYFLAFLFPTFSCFLSSFFFLVTI